MSLNWFNTSNEGEVTYSGNFKVIGDIEVTGLVRRNGEIFESITPQWTNTTTPGKIYFNNETNTVLVGIGTTNPQTPPGALLSNTLSVNGNISYTGDIFRNGARLDFGFGAWTGEKTGTIFYGGGDENRVGVGAGFVKTEGSAASTIPAKATIHAWSLSSINEITNESWDANMGIRIGPHQVNAPFLQMGVMKDDSIPSPLNGLWSWIQSARYTSDTNNPFSSKLLINPKGGNVGINVKRSFNVDASLSISSFGQFPSNNGFRRAISLAPETHETDDIVNSIIYSKVFAMGFRDDSGEDGGFYIMTNSGSISFKNNTWRESSQLSVKANGNVGIGTANPRLKLSISSSSANGILISNPQLQGGIDYGIQLNTDGTGNETIFGLGIGPLGLTGSQITNKLIIHETGIRVKNRVQASEYYIGSNPALISDTLGNTIVNSSLVNLGTLTSLRVGGEAKLDTVLRFNNHRIQETNNELQFSLSNVPRLTISNNGIDVNGNITQNGADILPLGSIVLWSGTSIPVGWVLCDGQSANGLVTPDLRGRFVLGANPGSGFNQQNTDGYLAFGGTSTIFINTHNMNTRGGTTQHTLTEGEMPAHSHGFCANINAFQAFDTSDGNEGYNTGGFGCTATASTGSSQPHNNMPPYYVLAYIMKVGGTASNPVLPGSGSGGQTGTPQIQISPKAFVHFSSVGGSVVIRNSFNISTITRLSVGEFRINFLNSLPNRFYTVAGMAQRIGTNGDFRITVPGRTGHSGLTSPEQMLTTNFVVVQTGPSSQFNSNEDVAMASIVIFQN